MKMKAKQTKLAYNEEERYSFFTERKHDSARISEDKTKYNRKKIKNEARTAKRREW